MSTDFVADWVAFSADITPEAAHVFEIAVQNPNRPPEVPSDIDMYQAVAFAKSEHPSIATQYAFFCNNMAPHQTGQYSAALVYVHAHEAPFGTHITKFIEVHPPKDLG